MTNQQLIDLALSKIGVVEAGDSANATDSTTALGVLNRMLAEWRERSLDLNWFTQDTLGDTAPLPEWAEEGVISNFAVRAASDFRVPVSGELIAEAQDGKRTIGNTLINQTLDNTDMSHLPYGEGRQQGFDIDTGS
jgi:hypothetical protein